MLVRDVRATVKLVIAGCIHCVTTAAALCVLMGGVGASLALRIEGILVATTVRCRG